MKKDAVYNSCYNSDHTSDLMKQASEGNSMAPLSAEVCFCHTNVSV